jgi:hypothetical protein
MGEISLILSVAGTLILFVVPVRLSIADNTKNDWDNAFPNWRTWLVIGMLLSILGISRLLAG